MNELLEELRVALTAQDLQVTDDGKAADGFQRWLITSPSEEVCLRLLIQEDNNGHPEIWCQCPDSTSTGFLTHLHVMIVSEAKVSVIADPDFGLALP